ncbi:flagellar hook-basal body protein [Exiguobacterium sp. SH1S4]|nr:flagellar hook-basal body protein [Exiguobacterium sp. SH4S7]TCI48364.1 flagellar hook-basal body protein [Exiguobacterium sp. SH5S32]TCI55252.1 flagellar hook-basal body protein [Exiguobacterium sp. SH1S4]TCI63264.1 flagellar hook-basal body protein [Exiguobacterium sp. SH0S2]TCI71035.1 flagellar hook-basal body protein [Exiguobacterium sp. SH0S7]TCI75044.1 flagellar hook-basal body protein [Exiguobacterium sp. SH1S1]TCI77971.1 flagellar hook-basal body protein [Exiguobacterium sp. SH0S1]
MNDSFLWYDIRSRNFKDEGKTNMLRGLYTAAGAMNALQRQQEILSNNLGNVRTPGFKASNGVVRSFPELLLAEVSHPGNDRSRVQGEVGTLSTGVYLQETMPRFSAGSVTATDSPTDVYLKVPADFTGAAMFAVEQNGEALYTTNGRFSVDDERFLRSADGGYILSDTGERIQLPSSDFELSGDGQITSLGQDVATLGAVQIDDLATLEQVGNDYRVNGGANPAANVQFQQGYIEEANVDLDRTMADLMVTYRQFEANQKVVQAYDKSAERAIEIARIR